MTCERGNLSRALLAFIVDQYFSRNQFSQTRASFRKEASSVFANARPNQNLLSLEEMMNQYIRMKKQNIELDKENMMLMQEKNRIQKLLQDMQNALEIFNVRSPSNVASMITNSALVPPVQNSNTTPPVASNTISLPPKPMNNVNFSSPMISVSGKKRKDNPTITIDGSAAAKKRRGRPPAEKKQVQDFGSSSAITQSSVGNFPVRASHISHNVSPSTDISPVATHNGEVISPSYNVISTKRVIVQPQEQMVYKEGNQDISPLEESKRDMADKTSMRALDVNPSHILENLDKSSSNEIPISDKERDNSAHLDFSGLDYWSKIYFSTFETEDSFTDMSRDIEMLNQEFFDPPA